MTGRGRIDCACTTCPNHARPAPAPSRIGEARDGSVLYGRRMTVTVSADITPTESINGHKFTTHLTGLDLSLSRLADFGSVFNATIDSTWEHRNMEKSKEFQEFFDFVWGEHLGLKAAGIMSEEIAKILDLNVNG